MAYIKVDIYAHKHRLKSVTVRQVSAGGGEGQRVKKPPGMGGGEEVGSIDCNCQHLPNFPDSYIWHQRWFPLGNTRSGLEVSAREPR